jgi:hypothetical protein
MSRTEEGQNLINIILDGAPAVLEAAASHKTAIRKLSDDEWNHIVRLSGGLSNEARSSIEYAIVRFRRSQDAAANRKGKSPWAFNRKDIQDLRQAVQTLANRLQPFLPHERTQDPWRQRVRRAAPELIEWLDWLDQEISIAQQSPRMPKKLAGLDRLVGDLDDILWHWGDQRRIKRSRKMHPSRQAITDYVKEVYRIALGKDKIQESTTIDSAMKRVIAARRRGRK